MQLNSSKSQIFLGSGSTTFYSLHATILNLLKKACRSLTASGKSVAVYRPVNCLRALSKSEGVDHEAAGLLRMDGNYAFLNSIEQA